MISLSYLYFKDIILDFLRDKGGRLFRPSGYEFEQTP